MMPINLKKRLHTSILLFFLILIIFKINFIFVYTLLVLGVLSIIEFLSMTKRFIKNKLNFFLINFIFISYIYLLFFIALFLYSNFETKIMIFSVLLCCVASDIGGFIFGKIFKGPKLTKISPNKTISGAIGSLILSCIVLSLIFYLLTTKFYFITLIVALVISLSCQTGDLIFSYFKRKAKIKDTGNFFPGHGGVLDRLDGILLGIPFGILAIIYFY